MRISDWSSDVCSSDLELLATTGHEASDIDWVVPHQANRRILEATARTMGIAMSRMIVTIDDTANTSAASVPLALDHGLRAGRLKQDDLAVPEAFGGGVNWGGDMLPPWVHAEALSLRTPDMYGTMPNFAQKENA